MHQSIYNKVTIVDFEDSNTYNIASILYPFEKNTNVIHHSQFFQNEFFLDFIIDTGIKAVVLGPGPGHPVKYNSYKQKILELVNNSSIYCMGICLGHQLILQALGYKVLSSKNPTHGLPFKINFKGTNCEVQRYNSLAVCELHKKSEVLSINGEVMISTLKQGITYQFHPESVATTNHFLFFEELILFIR